MIEPNKSGIFAGTLGIRRAATRWIIRPFEHHFERRYAGKYTHARKLFVFDLTLLITIIFLATFATYLIFFRPTLADRLTLRAESTPTEIKSGDQVTFTVFYENRNKVTLNNVDLALRLPAHFTFERSYPKEWNPRTNSIFLGSLAPGEHGQAKVTGILWADVGRSALVYSSATFVSEKDERGIKFTRNEFTVSRSVMELSVTGPETLVGGQSGNFSLNLKNSSDKTLSLIAVRPHFPQGFSLITSEPVLNGGIWRVGELQPQAEKIITLSGRMPASGKDSTLSFESIIEIDGDELSQGFVTLEKTLIPQPLSLNANIEGAPDSYFEPAKPRLVRVSYKNNGNNTLQKVEIGIKIGGPFAPQNEIVKSIEKDLSPNESGYLDIELTPLANIRASTAEVTKNFVLSIEPIGRAVMMGEIPISIDVTGPKISRPVATPFDFTALGYYWLPEGDQIGRGPIPPVVGETTKYWIFLNLQPTTNDLEHVEFSTTLPANVSWTDKSNVTVGSPIVWNEARRTVTWTIDKLDATSGTGKTVSARFEVAITPNANQIGESPTLVGSSTLTGRDVFTATNLESGSPPITTALTADKRAAGKGKVEAF